MPYGRSCAGVLLVAVVLVLASAAPLHAQRIEIAPFGGFRVGGTSCLVDSDWPLDVRGAPAVGAIVDVPLSDGLQVEAAFSHQSAQASRHGQPWGPATSVTVDHWQGGGLQEFLDGRARPFLTGVVGLTRYGVEGLNEFRFMTGAGGGIKLFPLSRIGLRLDGRVFATFIDADHTAAICSPDAGCAVALHVDVAWQAEFTAALVVRFPR